MQYIVLDMEWNQPWPGSPSAKKVLPSPIRGEIVQIGAVRMPRDGEVADEFQTLIRPAYYKKMNRKVASLTGIKDSVLKERGKPFREAMQAFHDWCGEDAAFLTWGFDDIVILKENLTLYGMDTAWVDTWYNAQLIFNAQTDGSSAQKSLSSAMRTTRWETRIIRRSFAAGSTSRMVSPPMKRLRRSTKTGSTARSFRAACFAA